MKKRVLGIAMIGAIALVSCNKEENEIDYTDSIGSETETLRLPEAGFEIVESSELKSSADGRYTEGIIQYQKNGEILATVDFADGTDEDHASIEQDGDKNECELEKMEDGKKGKFGKKKKPPFKKVIVEPIVKTDDCDYIVSGIMKFYDLKTGNWIATVDFGDGTCDDLATKETKEGIETFSIEDYHK